MLVPEKMSFIKRRTILSEEFTDELIFIEFVF